MPLFLMGCFPVDFQEVKRPIRTKSGKRPIKVRKRPIKERKRPTKAMVLVGVSVGCLMGCFRAPPPWRKTAPLKRPIKRSMIILNLIFRDQASPNEFCLSMVDTRKSLVHPAGRHPLCPAPRTPTVKTISTTPAPILAKKMPPVYAMMRGRMAQKSLEIKGLSQTIWCTNRLLWHTNSDFMA